VERTGCYAIFVSSYTQCEALDLTLELYRQNRVFIFATLLSIAVICSSVSNLCFEQCEYATGVISIESLKFFRFENFVRLRSGRFSTFKCVLRCYEAVMSENEQQTNQFLNHSSLHETIYDDLIKESVFKAYKILSDVCEPDLIMSSIRQVVDKVLSCQDIIIYFIHIRIYSYM
uniref:Uncharacterized protein n=1 Tax=Glossina palpalis gambiensis TaxID=67801 RepID=A0A1B0AUH1_9MUSC